MKPVLTKTEKMGGDEERIYERLRLSAPDVRVNSEESQ